MQNNLTFIKKTSNDIDTQIGQRLRIRRTLLGITQEELGKALKVTFQQVQKYERGINRISAAALYSIARILQTNINYFFTDAALPLITKSEEYIYKQVEHQTYIREVQDDYDDVLNEVETLITCYTKIKDPEVKKSILNLIQKLSQDAGS